MVRDRGRVHTASLADVIAALKDSVAQNLPGFGRKKASVALIRYFLNHVKLCLLGLHVGGANQFFG